MNGSYDEASSALQMKAVDQALRVYFDTEDWLAARRGSVPGGAVTATSQE